MRVTIVGAGVIGLSIAWELHQRGVEVTLLDGREAGTAASSANAGWISPSLAGPVPAPGIVRQSLKWMLNPESPLYIRPQFSPSYLSWLYRFWRACRPGPYQDGLKATAELGRRAFEIFDAWQEQGVDFEMHAYGLLFAFRDTNAMENDLKSYEELTKYGYEMPKPLLGAQVQQQEPALSNEIQGAFLVQEERTVQPISLVEGLLTSLRDAGVDIRVGTPVVDFRTSKGRVDAVRTPGGIIESDAVVLAAGAWTRDLAKMAGVRVPIEAGKGYGLDFQPAPIEVKSSIYLNDDRVAVSPFDEGVRLSGTMELSGMSERYTDRRICAIHKAGKRYLNGWPKDSEPTRVWTGMRPMSPDGLPVLGWAPGRKNLAIASGHAMLGVTLASVTGEEIAKMVVDGQPSEILEPFRVDRFGKFFL